MLIETEKFVQFFEYCPKCKHEMKAESEEPCYECISTSVRINSHKPIRFEEKDCSREKPIL